MATLADNAEKEGASRLGEDAPSSAFPRPSDHGDEATPLIITDDIAVEFPIGLTELEALETYLADVLDMVLASS